MKQEITVFVYMREKENFNHETYVWDKSWEPDLWTFKASDEPDRILIGEQTVTVEVPDDFDPVPKQVAALEAEKRAAMAEYQARVADINTRLSKLQAIEYAP